MTPDDKIGLLLVVLLPLAVLIGWCLASLRTTRECCDCCTCQTCTGWDDEDVPRGDASAQRGEMPEAGNVSDRAPGHLDWTWTDELGNVRQGYDGEHPVAPRRHTILLEPGPTIYPALAELAGEVIDVPESHREPIDSTFVRKLLIEWEQRYPIPVGAP